MNRTEDESSDSSSSGEEEEVSEREEESSEQDDLHEEGDAEQEEDSEEEDSDEEDSDVSDETSPPAAKKARASKPEDPFAALKEEMGQLSMAERLALRQKMGLRRFNDLFSDKEASTSRKRKPDKASLKRENKNRPQELPIFRRPVRTFHNVIEVKKKPVSRDPRFDDLSGEFREDLFKKNYSFIYDMRHRDKEKVKQQLKKTTDAETKSKLKGLLNWMNQKEEAEKQRERRAEIMQEHKKKEMEKVKAGKTPYFLKKSDVRKVELEEKMKELKEKGRLDKYLENKRRKKNPKEKKLLPRKRRAAAEASE